MHSSKILTIGYINIRGQSGLSVPKQLQIEAFAKLNKCDIINLQEAHLDSESFTSCDFIQKNFSIIENNSDNKYGTASLIKSELNFENVHTDTKGRAIIFDIGDMTFGNFYLQSGTDAQSKASRENYCCQVLPNMLINSKDSGCVGGDFNCIVNKEDATHYPEAKVSRGLQRLVQLKDWKDSFRSLFPHSKVYSRYYENRRAEGASRIDRGYHFGQLTVSGAEYIPLAFSDHFALLLKLSLPDSLDRVTSPKCRYQFRLSAEVIRDQLFKESLAQSMISWKRVLGFQGSENIDLLQWWELLVKPGIKKLGIERSKEIKKGHREELNLLLLRQRYLKIKLQQGEHYHLKELTQVHLLIDQWYTREGEKVQHQSRIKEFQSSERSSIYHHGLHKKRIKKSSILRLQSNNGIVEGHDACASFLEQSVEDLLLHPAQLDIQAQDVLLQEVLPVFTKEDNEKMLTPPTNQEVLKTIDASNLHAAPGTDGLPSLLYKECWPILGSALSYVMRSVFAGQKLTKSMNTSLMVFGAKPKKPNSILPGDKRKISLLNSDFKTATGLVARLLKKTATHSLSPLQLVAGSNRRIHHGSNMAGNAILGSLGKLVVVSLILTL